MIDPSIPLSVRAPQMPDPVQQLGAVMNLRAMQEDRQARGQAQQEETALRQLFSGESLPDPRAIYGIVGPERGAKIVQGLSALQTGPRGEFEATQKVLRDVILGMDALPDALRAEAYPSVRQGLIQRGVIGPDDAPPEYDPTWWARTKQYGQAPAPPEELVEVDEGGLPIRRPLSEAIGQPAWKTPPTPSRLTYGAPQAQIVAGRRVLVRPGSDGQMYGMDLKPIPADQLQPEPRPSAGQVLPAKDRRANQLADQFTAHPIVKRATTMAEGWSFAQAIEDATTNPTDDIGLIYAFAKLMDPESVVREGEYATVQKYAQSWAQQFGFSAARVFSNTKFLSTDAVTKLKSTIEKRYQAGRKSYDNLRANYVTQINRVTGADDGEERLIDYAGAFPASSGLPSGKIRARDPEGRLHEADAGTPLPPGWRVER